MKQCIHCTSVHVVSTYFSITGQKLCYTVLKLFGCPAHCLPLRCPVCSCCQEFPVCCQISSSLIPHSLVPTVLPGVTKPNFLILLSIFLFSFDFGDLAHWLAGLWQIPSSRMCIFLSLPPRLLWESIYMYSYDHNGKVKGKFWGVFFAKACWKSIR